MIRHWNICKSKKALVKCVLLACLTLSVLLQLAVLVLRFPDLGEPFDMVQEEDNENFNTENAEDGMIWEQYHYNQVRFQESIAQWRKEHLQQYHVLVVLAQPSSPYVSSESFVHAIHDALSSQRAQVVVYLHRQSNPSTIQNIATEFELFLQRNQLILLTSRGKLSMQLDNETATFGVRDDFFTAYLLDLSYQSKSDFTIALRCCRLQLFNSTTDGHMDFVTLALDHYLAIENRWKESIYITDRICWTHLSGIPSMSYDAILLNTSEHASRMSVTLRSSLPYNYFKYSDILNMYCNHFIWSGTIIPGPALFSPELASDSVWRNDIEAEHGEGSMDQDDPRRPYDTIYSIESEKGTVDPRDFGVPDWIDPTIQLGPRIRPKGIPAHFQIAFAVSAMIRPIVGTKYLETFLTELLHLMETEFQQSSDALDGMNQTASQSRWMAILVILVSGNTLEDIALLRLFLETQYADAIASGFMKLVDAPLKVNEKLLRHMRSTQPDDNMERRYWRSKQNLDLGALLEATVGLSDFVMMLEDDVEFHQKDFANHSKHIMQQSVLSLPLWAQAYFGFGFAGVLLRGMDVPVYQHLHTTFFDEKPCDVLRLHEVVRSGFTNHVGEYLSHLGRHSSLPGKIQDTFIHD
jgi:N-Acetylglucosaminyltransferase-IV (GnT-IV) conserved region